MGAGATDVLLDYHDDILDGTAILEVGATALGPYGEGSTLFLTGYMMNRPGCVFYTMDTNEHTIESLRRFERLMPGRYHALCGDTMHQIEQIAEPISFAYLDNFDYLPPGYEDADWMLGMIDAYKQNGVDLTNENSAQAHLDQAKLVASKAADRCVILFDDTWRISTGKTFPASDCKPRPWQAQVLEQEGIEVTADTTDWYGKGATAVPWLLNQGWNLIPHNPEDHRPRDDWTALKNW